MLKLAKPSFMTRWWPLSLGPTKQLRFTPPSTLVLEFWCSASDSCFCSCTLGETLDYILSL